MDSCLTVYSVLTIYKQMDGEYDCEILLSKNIYYVIIVLANVFWVNKCLEIWGFFCYFRPSGDFAVICNLYVYLINSEWIKYHDHVKFTFALTLD